ncbi:DUF2905 domain-containing protein [Edaphobacter bradus]|uniref:DUF2905 domain-containing protein n=1 Tax=Edaphobacter bradus TaxID=2259016 RepID=UPI0021E06E11|nr:DUF2905 domain-containing protein [Edaphobacter bradus]
MSELGRIFVFFGLLFLVVGLIAMGLGRLHLPLGRLPGDFTWRGRGWTISVPLATCLVFSLVLSLIFWVVNRLHR